MFFERPWSQDITPGLCRLIFEESKPEKVMRRDIFHNTKTGIFRDFVGGCVTLCMNIGYWHEAGHVNNRKVLMQRAHASFKLWAVGASKSPGLRSFSETFFNCPTWSSYAWVNSKGSDTMLLLQWIATQMTAFLLDPVDAAHTPVLRMMMAGAQTAVEFSSLTYNHGLWLPRSCGHRLCSLIDRFLRIYNHLAYSSMHTYKYTAFGKKGKLHMLCHTKQDLADLLADSTVLWLPNPQLWGCEGNEDVVGRASRLSRRCSHRQSARRTLEMILIKSKALHTRWCKANGFKGLKPKPRA